MLVNWIGFRTETMRLSYTTTVTFVVQFFNTAFLLLLVGANMSEQPFGFGLNGGSFTDFNSAWFRTLGNTLAGTMWFNAFFPVIEALGYFGLRIFFRLLDKGCSCDKYKTKKTSIQAYLNVYTGPVYLMHYKYSTMLNVIFVTFVYGAGIPILFPIAALSMLILYFQEKLMLYYGYRVPPMYDERLSQKVLNQLQWAPMFLLFFGYWMYSNQQLLSNDHLTPIANKDDSMLSSHTYDMIIHNQGWTGFLWTMLFAGIILGTLNCCGGFINKLIESCFPSFAIGDIEVDEDIDNYWSSLDAEDRKWSKREEENARGALRMQMLLNRQFETLEKSQVTEGRTLQGCHSYDILANPLYFDDFQYVTAAEDDRTQMIIDDDLDEDNDAYQSDFVRIALNLAFLNEQEARSFRCDKKAFASNKHNSDKSDGNNGMGHANNAADTAAYNNTTASDQ